MPRLLLVDGPNIVMRCAHGGKIPPERSVPVALRMIQRTAAHLSATHLVLAWDGAENFRRTIYPDYKGHRTTDTHTWCQPAAEHAARLGWLNVTVAGFEADDVIATLAARTAGREGMATTIFTGDFDLAQLVGGSTLLAVPQSGDAPRFYSTEEIIEKLGVAPSVVPDLKALAGEPGDGVPGVWGKKHVARAKKMLGDYGSLAAILEGLVLAPAEAEIARRNRQLLTLRTDVPVPPLEPARCAVPVTARAVETGGADA